MSTSNLTWPLLMDSLNLGTRAINSLVLGVSRSQEVMPHTDHTMGLLLPTNLRHLKV